MVINLIGILDDGTPFAPGVPTDARKTLNIPIGGTVNINVTALYTPSGTLIDQTTGSLVLTVRKTPPYNPIITKTPLSTSKQLTTFQIVPADTKSQPPGSYIYDIWFTNTGSGARDSIVPLSPMFLLASVAQPP